MARCGGAAARCGCPGGRRRRLISDAPDCAHSHVSVRRSGGRSAIIAYLSYLFDVFSVPRAICSGRAPPVIVLMLIARRAINPDIMICCT